MEISDIKSQLNKVERVLIGQEAEKNTLQTLLDEQESSLKELLVLKDDTKKAQLFLLKRASDTRLAALAKIEEVMTPAVQQIYDPDYTFSFDLKEISSKDSENTGLYTIQPSIEKTIDGVRVKRPIRGSNGGGLMEIVSLILRIAFGTYNNYDGIYVIDEALASVSKENMKRLLIFLDKFIKELDLQVMLVSHDAAIFSEISDMNFYVYKVDGIACVGKVSKEELFDLQSQISIDEKNEDF